MMHSHTIYTKQGIESIVRVLILVVMDDALALTKVM